MPVVTQLKVQKRDKDRVSVFLDGEYAFSTNIMDAAKLSRGQELKDEEIASLRLGGETHLAYQKAIRYLSYRPRSCAETEKYLTDKGCPQEAVAAVLSKLSQQGYLDDRAFARFWVENREQFRPRGRRALQFELRQKGIGQNDIDAVLTEFGEDEAAWRAIDGKYQRWRDLDEYGFKQRAISYLGRRGFPYGVCRETAEHAWLAASNEREESS